MQIFISIRHVILRFALGKSCICNVLTFPFLSYKTFFCIEQFKHLQDMHTHPIRVLLLTFHPFRHHDSFRLWIYQSQAHFQLNFICMYVHLFLCAYCSIFLLFHFTEPPAGTGQTNMIWDWSEVVGVIFSSREKHSREWNTSPSNTGSSIKCYCQQIPCWSVLEQDNGSLMT